MSSKRLAVVGVGLIGRRHVEAIQRSGSATLASVVDPSFEAVSLAAEHAVACYPTLAEMLSVDPPDGVIIATPNQLHVENGMACIAARTPMLIEKPIADGAPAALGLVNAAQEADVPILVGHHRRHNPIIKAAKARIDSGAVGDIVAVQAACWLYKPDDYYEVAWRTQLGAGPILINLIHDVDLLRHLVGPIASLQAFASNSTRGFSVEDTAAILLRFANGALGTLTVSDTIVAPWSWELTAAENPAYPETGQTCYTIGGTRGSLEVPTGRLWFQHSPRSWWNPIQNSVDTPPPLDPLAAQITHFCDVIAGDATPLVSGREGYRSLQVIEAIKTSIDTGQIHQFGPTDA